MSRVILSVSIVELLLSRRDSFSRRFYFHSHNLRSNCGSRLIQKIRSKKLLSFIQVLEVHA
jgi:hypothetical protein